MTDIRVATPAPSRSPAPAPQKSRSPQAPAVQRADVLFRPAQRSASPRGVVPSKDLSSAEMAAYVSTILSSPPATSRSVVCGYSPRPAARQPSVRTVPASQTRRVTTQPRVVSASTPDDEDRTNRRQGPVVVTMDTQVPELKMPGRAMDLGAQLAPDIMVVNTPYGRFEIPNYDLMSRRDRDIAMDSYRTKFMHINHDWRHTGDSFDLPRPNEDVTQVAVRYLETERYLSAKTGTDFWFIILCAFWGFIEYQACSWKLPAKGYVESQIGMYKMYQSQLTRMGTVSNVGADWPPWLQVCVTSGFSMAVLVLLAKFNAGDHAGKVMKEISYMISGNRAPETSEAGTPKPPEGGMIEMITGMASGGGIGTVMSLFSGMMGGGGDGGRKKKKKKSKKRKEKDDKEAAEAADVDI